MKTATSIDNLKRYSDAFGPAVSVAIVPICICCRASTVRTIDAWTT
ncbi:hypothetical protein [Burkholderia sp. SRS-W-2-2016]|nr:hypothetical protein [Burkholderia sp. SRS-W-2-2016]